VHNAVRPMDVPGDGSTVAAGGADAPPEVLEALRSVYDPCCRERGISIVDMGLVPPSEGPSKGRTRTPTAGGLRQPTV
jgi:hypothetical protein